MSTPYRLPIVLIDGLEYFADHRLSQVREVDNPHNFLSYDEVYERAEYASLDISEKDMEVIRNRLVAGG